MRRFVLVFALIALAVALWTATAHAQSFRGPGGPGPAPTPDKIVGMDADLLGESLPTQVAQLADMKRNLHITMARVDLNWEYVQYGGPTTYDWSLYDPLISAIEAAGMKPLIIIQGTASWASASGSMVAQPVPAQFAAFVTAVVDRYGAQDYEIWNEPNNTYFWSTPNAAVYTTLLQDSYQAIKAVAPSSTVISGGLAPETTSGGNIAPVTFLQQMYAAGAEPFMNAVGYHPYSYDALPNTYESWSGWSQMSATSPSIRSVMVANGDAGKQVWITEVGYPSNAPSYPAGINGLTAEADEVSQVNAFANANSWVGPVFWYVYQDDASGPFGLLTSSGAHKLAYTTMAGL
jgi:Cellulase (glycosyl hydrolase family 5)